MLWIVNTLEHGLIGPFSDHFDAEEFANHFFRNKQEWQVEVLESVTELLDRVPKLREPEPDA